MRRARENTIKPKINRDLSRKNRPAAAVKIAASRN